MAEATKGATPEPMAPPSLPEIPSTLRKISDLPPDEYRSPAFVKRARLSYGALFEGGFDIFEEDGGVKGRGRKRTRFGRDSSAWRYSSQSPSPEPMEEEAPEDVTPQPSPKPKGLAESHQIIDVDMEQGTPESASAAAPPETPVPAPRQRPAATVQNEQTPISKIKQTPAAPPHEEEPAPTGLEAPAKPAEPASGNLPDASATAGPNTELAQRAPQGQPQEPNLMPESDAGDATQTTLFGPKSFPSDFPSFGTAVPPSPGLAVSLADQVRFGFSHTPQTTLDSSRVEPSHAAESEFHGPDPYPLSYLGDASAPAEYAAMSSYPDMLGEQDDMNVPSQAMPLEPPAIERFGHGQWEMSTQSPHYNPIEGGHFGPDALGKGERLAAADQPLLHADGTAPKEVPGGFAAYGNDVSEDQQEPPENLASPHEYDPLVANEDTISGSEVGVDDEEDEDEKEDEVAYGERVEEGDYDQRNYDVPSDDYEGLSEEEDEIELEAEERYGNGEVYDEDGEGEEWDEEEDYESDEEEEESEEEDDDASGYHARKAPARAAPAEPVVISLLSDSEDEDEPVPAPKKAAPAAQVARPPEPPMSSQELSNSDQPSSPSVLETVEADTIKEHVQDNVLNKIHVVDFATRVEQATSTHTYPMVPLAGMDNGSVPSVGTSQTLGSFELSSARDESYTTEFRSAAASQGSSEGLFVSQPNSQHAPSESSSEGLFISQPRPRSPDTVDKQIDSVSDDYLETTDDASTDGGKEPESDAPELAESHDDSMSIEEEERHETLSESSEADDGESLPDADDASFASQVETAENLEASEDEDMDAEDQPSAAVPALRSVSLEVEEIVEFEEDVDMIDAGPAQPEPASEDQTAARSPLQKAVPETFSVITEPVATEVASGTSVVAAEGEPVPGAHHRTQQDSESTSLAAGRQEIANEGSFKEPSMGETPKTKPEGPKAGQNEFATQTTSPGGFQDGPASVLQGRQDDSEKPSAQARPRTPPPSAQTGGECGQGVVVNAGVPNMDGASSPKMDMGTRTQEEEVVLVPDSQIPAEPLTIGRQNDDTTQQARPPARVSTPEQDRKEAPNDKEGSAKSDKSGIVQHPTPPDDDLEDETMILEQLTQEQQQYLEGAAEAPMHGRSPTPDLSVTLARQAVASRRSKPAEEAPAEDRSPTPDLSVTLARQAVASRRNKPAPEPVRTSPRVTRARSNSLRSNATNDTPEKEGDNSVSLARAALASPSRKTHATPAATPTTSTSAATRTKPTATMAALKSELAKRLRTDLPECLPLKSLRNHVGKLPNALVVATTAPPAAPARAKGGPRQYFMSFHATDPSAAPGTVIEVQMYHPHKDVLPVVAPGDVVLLQKFQVMALSGKGFGLRTGAESAWAVWEGEGKSGGDGGGGSGAGAPQIRGRPVEDWDKYVGYVDTVREWFGLVMGDGAAREKLERADRKLAEAGGGGGGK